MGGFFSELRLYICNHLVANVPSHRIRLWFYRKIMKFQIGSGTSIFMNCKFDCVGNLTIGKDCVVNANCRLDPRGGIEIGNNVSLSEDVIFITADHNEDIMGDYERKKKIVIDDYVWIGTRAMVLPGVKIEKGALVAAGSVVTRDVKYVTIVAGIPAKKINTRPEKFDYPTQYRRLFQ
jgi:acetyltransferase-like isoleucine patch superfamily enzyme